MESGLEGRNNEAACTARGPIPSCLNGVRPRRPEQCAVLGALHAPSASLNGVRPRRPEQFDQGGSCCAHRFGVSMESGLEGRNNIARILQEDGDVVVSMESGLEGRNNRAIEEVKEAQKRHVSMESGLEGRNNSRI